MKMKKYTASTMALAMKKVEQDLGDDAIIVSSKVVYSKGFLGMFKKKSIEVIAGKEPVRKTTSVSIPEIDDSPKDAVLPNEHSEKINKELADLKSLVKTIQRQSVSYQYPDEYEEIIQRLEQQELNPELITAVGDELFQVKKNGNEKLAKEDYKELAKEELIKLLQGLPFGGLSYNKKYINVLGPTGVGKTTTIAKMAALAVLQKKKKIGFITTDTYRIAAIEQLKIYANLLQSPVEIVYSKEDYEQALVKFDSLDIVFIDTAGRNYREAKYINDLRELINIEDNMENYLVLSLTAKEQDMTEIVDQFSEIPIEKFIFTKMDETISIGSMINLMVKYKKGLAYYTNGQEVPEDIEEATAENIVELLIQGD